MVIALYLLILIPTVAYLIFSVIEIRLTWLLASRKSSRRLLFVQASTEVTHTLLVFAYAQFMTTFSGLLVYIGATLWWPIALLMTAILLRGSLYLVLFNQDRPNRASYGCLLATYVAGVVALVWALVVIIPALVQRGFIPDTSHVALLFTTGVPVLCLITVPIIAVYRHAFGALNR
jgi:hypothetical protein